MAICYHSTSHFTLSFMILNFSDNENNLLKLFVSMYIFMFLTTTSHRIVVFFNSFHYISELISFSLILLYKNHTNDFRLSLYFSLLTLRCCYILEAWEKIRNNNTIHNTMMFFLTTKHKTKCFSPLTFVIFLHLSFSLSLLLALTLSYLPPHDDDFL